MGKISVAAHGPDIRAAGGLRGRTAAGLELTYTDGDGGYPGLDRFDRIVNQRWQKTDTTLLDGYAYDYDRASNRASRKNVGPSATALDELYGYDGLNRLTSFQRGAVTGACPDLSLSTKVQKRQWLLEALGNWRQFQVNSNYADDEDYTDAGDLNQARTHNKVNEIYNATAGAAITEGTSPPQAAWVDPVHDAAGNMTQAPLAGSGGDLSAGQTRLHLVYDAWNRQAVVKNDDGQGGPGTDRLVCRYDGLGRRIIKVDKTGQSDVTYHYYYNEAWQVLEERIGDDPDPYAQYVWDARYIDAPVLRWRDTTSPPDGQVDETLYFTNDANMNVTAAVDASAAVQERYTYDAYGTPTFRQADWSLQQVAGRPDGPASAFANEILFCGYRYDTQTGYYLVRYRVYHPDLGAWAQKDPLEPEANAYLYIAANPLLGFDPYGLWYLQGHSAFAERGDTLSSLASILYGDPSKWTLLNYQGDPRKLKVGQAIDASKRVSELELDLDRYLGALRMLDGYANNIARDCCADDQEAWATIRQIAGALVQANAFLSNGMGFLATSQYAARTFPLEWMPQLKRFGNALAIVGIGIEAVNFGKAVGSRDTPEVISSGGLIVGGVWGLWNPWVAGATAAGSIGKYGIEAYYEHKINESIRETNEKACKAWKTFAIQYLARKQLLEPAARSAMDVFSRLSRE